MSHRCCNCGEVCTPRGIQKLSDWEKRELSDRAHNIVARFPPNHQRDGRWTQLQNLADEYGISRRTVYRYLRRAA